jgi:DNA-directed RNA polymerase specialized sigma24 family protein
MRWEEIYSRLVRDREDAGAWAALEYRVRTWARRAFRQQGWQLAASGEAGEAVVAETCASVAVTLDSARGAETFAGFVCGHFLDARRRVTGQHQHAGTDTVAPVGGNAGAGAPTRPGGDGPTAAQLGSLHRALVDLPELERRAVALCFLEGRSAAEVGVALRVGEADARRIVFTGVARLRRRLGAPRGARAEMAGVA